MKLELDVYSDLGHTSLISALSLRQSELQSDLVRNQ